MLYNITLKDGLLTSGVLCLRAWTFPLVRVIAHQDTDIRLEDFDLAWFSSLFSKHLCVFGLGGAIYYFFLLTSFSLPFSELSLVGLALDLVD